ncbi:MAG: carotenoid oxygenase family protein [Alphaproteobacteria bacterium]
MINRRRLLQGAALAGMAGAVAPLLPFARAKAAAPPSEEWKQAFDTALKTDPHLLGWQGVTVEALDAPSPVLEGAWPAELAGTFYRNGPAQHERGGARYRHWFDGDGMVQAFRIEGGKVAHRGRFVATEKRAVEQAAGRLVVPAFGTTAPESSSLGSADEINPGNIAPLFHAGELLALWEGGSAHVVDAESLETRGRKVWRDDLKGLPFTAHPKVEADGTLWGFGYDATGGRLVLYHIGPDGALKNVGLVPAAPLGMVHDFVVTERHLVFALAPLVIEPGRFDAQTSFLDGHVWRPELGMRALAVAKDDLKTTQSWQLPAGFSFHFGNAWEEADGTIRFDYCVGPDATLMTETLRYVMRGEWRSATAPMRFAEVVLRPRGDAGEQTVGAEAAEFPRVAPGVVGRRYRHVYSLGASDWDWFTAVVKRDLESGERQVFDYGADYIAEEHVFVPRPGAAAEDDGWLIGTALDIARGVTTLNLFDARKPAGGPLARAVLPYALPLGFHGIFAPNV